MRLARRLVIAGALALSGALVAIAPAAWGQDAKDAPSPAKDSKDAKDPNARAEEASQRFKSGVNFYKDKDFTAALVDFKRAYELVPNWIVLYNLGQTARELHDHAAALAAYEQYLRDGGARVPAARRKEVTAALDELRHKVGRVRVTTPVDGAQIAIDDVVVGVTPLADGVTVNAGRRKVAATAAGYIPVQRMIDVASMEEAKVSLDLEKAGGTTVVIAPPATETKSIFTPAFWGAAGATAAVGIAAGITGVLALEAHASLNSALGVFPGNAATIASDQSRTRALAAATDVLGALTLAGAATTVVVFVVLPRVRRSDPNGASPAVVPATASVGVTPGGLSVSASF